MQAAIERLETLRSALANGPWEVEEIPETGECRVLREAFSLPPHGRAIEEIVPGGIDRVTAELIVTLHRTIDAQLAILRSGIAKVERHDRLIDEGTHFAIFNAEEYLADEIALASAILGVDS